MKKLAKCCKLFASNDRIVKHAGKGKTDMMMNVQRDSKKKIAIVGASRSRRKFGNKAVRAYGERGYQVYPVHPEAEEIEGYRAYRSVREIPDDVELVSFYVPPSVGLKVIDEVAQKEAMKVVYLNPGSESRELIEKGRALGLEMKELCSLLAIGADPSRY